jgi:N-methylhydantoinase B
VTGFEIKEGRVLEYHQAGGGGWGDPLTRDPAWVLEDVRDGYVTVEGAQRDYGVVIVASGEGYKLDVEATSRQRGELSAARARS